VKPSAIAQMITCTLRATSTPVSVEDSSSHWSLCAARRARRRCASSQHMSMPSEKTCAIVESSWSSGTLTSGSFG